MLVAFAGCDGAGKTTQVKRVRHWLEKKGWYAEIIDRWDILNVEKFPECRFIHSSRKDLPLCISEMEGLSRALFLFWSVSITIQEIDLRDRSRIYLVDGYWMKHAAAEIEYGCDPGWIETTVRCMPQADVTLYLDITPEEALRRKPDVTPYECARNPEMDPKDFIRHQTNMRRRLLGWANDLRWNVVSSMRKPSLVTEEIGLHLEGRLREHERDAYPVSLVDAINP
jgi:thymidylate kinase